jgi:hypothetical protein
MKKWNDNMKMDLRKRGYEDGRWMELSQDHADFGISGVKTSVDG